MFGRYATVLRIPGAFATSASAFVGRLPIAMIGLSTVLLITAHGGSYALAGAISATFVLSGSFAGPGLARYVDRMGQRRVVPWLTLVFSLALLGFVAMVQLHWPPILFALVAAVAGAAQPNFGVLIRARWSFLLTGTPGLRVAYAIESLLDEVIFVAGPPLATFLSVAVLAALPLWLAVVLTVVGTVALLTQRRTEPPPTTATSSHEGPVLFARGMPVLAAVFLLQGALFGGFEVAAVAFGQEHGSRAYAGPMLALWSLGSLVGGLAYGARRTPVALPRAFLIALGVVTVASAPFYFAPNVPVVCAMFLVGGLAVSPSLIAGFSLVEASAPEGRMNEALSWAMTGLGTGVALSATLTGAVIDAHGANAAFLVGSSAAALALLVAWSGRRETERAYRPVHEEQAEPTDVTGSIDNTDPGALPGGPEVRD